MSPRRACLESVALPLDVTSPPSQTGSASLRLRFQSRRLRAGGLRQRRRGRLAALSRGFRARKASSPSNTSDRVASAAVPWRR